MPSGLSFLMAARRCEIDELAQLERTVALVGGIGGLVHALQKERGISNVFLGSGGTRFAAERTAQAEQAQAAEQGVRAALERLQEEPQPLGSGARLFNRVAWVLPGLDALPQLRARIGAGALSPTQAAAAFAKLIAGLLAVVFEAADGATDPQVSRWLAAMFNFMQGKEFAGQERACGAAAFSRGRCDTEQRLQWLHLIDSQERCFHLFDEFADAAPRARWQAMQAGPDTAELERLRRIGCAAQGPALDAGLSAAWFDCCTRRIDAMRALEETLSAGLHALCEHKIAQAHEELRQYEALRTREPGPGPQPGFFDAAPTPGDAAPASPYGRHLERSVLDMVQEQSRRLQAMSDELETVRASLNERKLVERAKGLLMAHRRLSEEEAHKMLRQTSMNQNRRLVEVAESVLAMADLLSTR
ncbi:MAG: nitrate- and nitrite sensing domain-containing protein [Xenophilus sp.]